MNRTTMLLVAGLLVAGMTVNAQTQTWDPDGNLVSDGGNGTWDNNITPNWIAASPWVNGNNAIFGDSGGDYTVAIGDSGVTVGDLTYSGTSNLTFESVTDNNRITIASGGATWNTGGGTIAFNNFNDGSPLDVGVTIGSGDKLTVAGGGSFDTGESPNGANWIGDDIEFSSSTWVKGSANTIGQIGTTTFAAGGTYVHGRNSNQDYNNDWVLDGDVTFDNTWNGRTMWANGVFSGTGRLTVEGMGTTGNGGAGFLRLNDTANSWSGGLTVNGGINSTVVLIAGGDSVLGAVPGTFDADNIILKDGGALKMAGMNLNANRGITLEGTGGTIVNLNNANTINGAITGEGNLAIGRYSDGSANTTILASDANDYEGETRIVRGELRLGIDNALPSGTVVRIGGNGTSALDMNGYDATIGGVYHSANNTRQIENNGGSASTLTLDVADGESYTYSANVTGAQTIDLVKTGLGTQTLSRSGNYATPLGNVTVNDGELVWKNTGTTMSGTMSVGASGTLSGDGLLNGAVSVDGNLNPGLSPGTLAFDDILTLGSTAILNLEITGAGAGEYDVLLNDGGDLLTAGGTLAFDATSLIATNGQTFTVFENWGGFAGSFNGTTGADLGGGLSLDTTNLLVDGTVMVIPEPATLGMVALLGGAMLFARRVFSV